MENTNKAIVLISGGLDSATTLAIAKHLGFNCHGLSFDYKQRNISELVAAKNIAVSLGTTEHKIIKIDLAQIGGSALTDTDISVPNVPSEGIPVTYVPARNTIFLSISSSFAERYEINDIFLGVNKIDYSGYPDCRPEYIEAFEKMINLGTKRGVEGNKLNIHTPLINMSKAEIILKGTQLKVDYSKTLSCYSPNKEGHSCGVCDSCRFRKQGFLDANIEDPTIYKKSKK